ncbi:hypothetical protein PF001_g2027 [Phytophthora fragariae]|uniref:Uncharacterized protein n=2 Tax=Phytophthora fragariae TaxID=53985 RepID=A0A6A4F2R5_9STRA|nr:hypothetical protein PF001_g2027 [Phytophthora fragariae]
MKLTKLGQDAAAKIEAAKSVLSTVSFKVLQVLTPAQVNELRVVDCSLLEDVVEAGYTQHVFAVGQLMTVRCDGLSLCLQCMDIGTVDGDSSSSARIGSYLHMSSFICFASLQLVFCKTINVDLVCPCYYLAFLNTACLFILFA